MTETLQRRVFFALWPDDQARAALDALAAQGAKRCGGRCVLRENLHLTLAFIGAVSQQQLDLLQQLAAGVVGDAYDLQLDRLGYWSRSRILWAGCSMPPPAHDRLVAALGGLLAAAGFQLEKRPHLPHMTLVRQAHCRDLPVIDQPVKWHVIGFSLVESSLQPAGATYHTLARWPLRGSV